MNLQYTPTEKIKVEVPKNRIEYIVNACKSLSVLDLGCYDETALIKNDTDTYLFAAIDKVSKMHIGIDNSQLIPEEGIVFSEASKILKGDITNLINFIPQNQGIDIIIAGELIEHLPNTLGFFISLKKDFPGIRLICSTPNTTSLSNILLAFFKRESCHKDHFQVYSIKTLNTLCLQANFKNWKIIPYHVKYTEMILRSKGLKKIFVRVCERTINLLERLFPMTSGGYLVDIEI